MANPASGREKFIHIIKRSFTKKWISYAVRIGGFLLALLICGTLSAILTDKTFGRFFYDLFDGAFGTERRVWDLFHNTALLLLVALAVTPAFKMKFWNIGAEGQVLVGALACAGVIHYLGAQFTDESLIPIMLLASVVASSVWAVIPALFKAKWNTNETLFTLMMNYIATCLTAFCIASWAPLGSGTLTFNGGFLPEIVNQFLLKILVAVILMVFLFVYLRFSKHGYEITVVGESENTARYIGINVKKVIIRTMVLCGILCGIAGFLLVSGTHHALHKTDTVAGRGFTAILVSWLAKFNPLAMGLTAFLVVFIQKGTGQFSTLSGLGASYPDVMTGIFFIVIIASEFFINYRVVLRFPFSKKAKAASELIAEAAPSPEGTESTLTEPPETTDDPITKKEDKE